MSSSQQSYRHARLKDQKEQIRLLRIDSSDHHGRLCVALSTFDRASAPSYAALSYTWGDGALSKTISCHDKVLSVTKNCWYALKQLRRFGLFDYYWIDSICINQADSAEKIDQVNAMGSTYRQADAVLVSLGKHTAATTYLFDLVTTNGVTAHHDLQEDEVPIDSWLKTMDESTTERLLSALTSFASLPYWNRLWTVQEFALPREVYILCGNGCLSWDILSTLNAMLLKMVHINRDWFRGQSVAWYSQETLENLPMNRTQSLRRTVRDSAGGLANFGELILRLGTRDCLDPRDRIFGVLSLVEWPNDSARLEADYSMAAADLVLKALQVSGHSHHPKLAGRLIEMLEVTVDDSAMQSLQSSRLNNHGESLRGSLKTRDLPVSFVCSTHPLQISGREKVVPVAGGWDLVTTNRLGAIDPLVKHSMLVPNAASPYDIVVQLTDGSRTPTLGFRQETVGDHRHYDRAALALRDQGAGIYEIMGNVVFSQDRPSLPGLLHDDEDQIDFALHLDPEDLVFWAWQLQNPRPTEVNGSHFDRDHNQLGTRFCHKPFSSYATATKRSDRHTQRNMMRTAASLIQNAAAVRQKLALLRMGG